MFEMPQFQGSVRELFDTQTIHVSGVIHGSFKLNKVTSDIDEAIDGVKYVLVVTPAFAHDSYARLLKGRTTSDQIIVIYPGAFAGLLFRTTFGDTDCPVVAEVNNLPYDTRLIAPCRVAIYGHNKVNVAFMPAAKGPELIDDMRDIHPYERLYSDVLEAGLSIVNPGVHAGPCLLSITAIENSPKRPFFLYEHGVTPSSCRVNLQIDNERKEIGRKLGYTLTPIEDFTGLSVAGALHEHPRQHLADTHIRAARHQEPVLHRRRSLRPGAVEPYRQSGRGGDPGDRLRRQHLQRCA